MPSVVMNDGTRRRVVIRPLTRPTATPMASSSAMTGQVLPAVAVDQPRGDDHDDGDERPDGEVELARRRSRSTGRRPG